MAKRPLLSLMCVIHQSSYIVFFIYESVFKVHVWHVSGLMMINVHIYVLFGYTFVYISRHNHVKYDFRLMKHIPLYIYYERCYLISSNPTIAFGPCMPHEFAKCEIKFNGIPENLESPRIKALNINVCHTIFRIVHRIMPEVYEMCRSDQHRVLMPNILEIAMPSRLPIKTNILCSATP